MKWTKDKNKLVKDTLAMRDQEIENSIKLFTTMYGSYFGTYWKLDELIEKAREEAKAAGDKITESQLNSFIKLFENIKTFYSSQTKH